jgi:GH35 family endo-1,4-beta-xylanase
MLRFAIHDNQGFAEQWPLTSAYLMGADDAAIPAQVQMERGGTIACKKANAQPAALSLLYDVGPMGRLQLQTCMLPEREQPYVLALELARHRIKLFIVKSEEWQMFELSAEHPATLLWEEARRLFTDALNMADSREADRTARKSLIKGIDATERLAMAHAEVLLHRRYAAKAASSVTLGVRIWPQRDAAALREVIEKDFDVVSIPLRWNQIEHEEGRYQWDAVDRWMDWASKLGKPILAGPLLDFSAKAVPKWMYVWQHDYDTTRDLAYDFMEKVVQRYKGVVGVWSLGAGLYVNDNFEFKPAQMLDLTRTAALLVRQARKGARTMIELTRPFGEFGAARKDALAPLTFVEQLVQEGIRVDCLGVQLLCGTAREGQVTRDLMQISAMLDRFFLLEIPVLVTAFGSPSGSGGSGDSGAGGWWHQEWSPESQSRWATRVFAIAMSKPFVESVVWNDLYDHAQAELPEGGLISDSGRAKPALNHLIGVRRRLRKPLGPLKLGAPAQLDSD